jgi:hypothetical protein
LVALACAYLGLRSTPKPEKVLAVLADGVVGAGGLSPASLTDALCERLFKTTSDDRPENVAVSDAVARGSSTVDKPSVLHPATETGSSGSPEPQDLARFAAEAVEAARRTKDGWFGDGMVFVSHAFRSFHNGKGSLSFVEFKDALLRAHRAGHLALAGADMPQALPSEDLEESLIKHGDSKFYFVRV